MPRLIPRRGFLLPLLSIHGCRHHGSLALAAGFVSNAKYSVGKPSGVRFSVGAFQPMKSVLEQALEWLGLAGLAGLAAFIPWTKLGLGAAFTMLAAFFPNAQQSQRPAVETSESETSGSNKMKSTRSVARDALRLGLVVVGITFIVGAVSDGHQNYVMDSKINQPLNEAKAASRLNGKERTSRHQNAPSTEDSTPDRTFVRSENRSSLSVTSSSASKVQTNAPVSKWKFLHK